VPSLESSIDDLYKLQLSEFVSARTALAKTLAGAEQKRVKALVKPTVVPWTANQLFWHARPEYDRLAKAGEKLRAQQIAALKGRTSALQPAVAAHRQALADAVAAATRLALEAGQNPPADALGRMLEAVSLSERLPEPAGRFTKPLQPAGFEALVGLPLKAAARPQHLTVVPPRTSGSAELKPADRARAAKEREREAERERAAQVERARQEALRLAETAVNQAKAGEAEARKAWENARDRLSEAERELEKLRETKAGRQPSKK
jgi:hypothetical protein